MYIHVKVVTEKKKLRKKERHRRIQCQSVDQIAIDDDTFGKAALSQDQRPTKHKQQ